MSRCQDGSGDRRPAASAPTLPPAGGVRRPPCPDVFDDLGTHLDSTPDQLDTMAKFALLACLLSVAAALQAPVTKVAPIARSGVRR